MVEGGTGDCSLTHLRKYGTTETRTEIAEKYLRLGIITSEEYLNIVSDHPVTIWGVEDKDLYEQQLNIFLETESLTARLKPTLSSIRQIVEPLKEMLWSESLVDLTANSVAYDEDQLSLSEYLNLLAGYAVDAGIDLEETPEISNFLHIYRLELNLDYTKISSDQQSIFTDLSRLMEKSEFEELVARANGLKPDSGSQREFYLSLEQIAQRAGVNVDKYPHFTQYVNYVDRSNLLDVYPLIVDVRTLVNRLRITLADSTPQSRKLATIYDQLVLSEKLLQLGLTPDEFDQLNDFHFDGLASDWLSFLMEQSQAESIVRQISPDLMELEDGLPIFKRYYEIESLRVTAFVDNIFAKLDETNENRVSVLISGGYHSPRIMELLQRREVGIVALSPKVTEATNEALYHAVLKYKSGNGTYEEVVAASKTDPDSEISP